MVKRPASALDNPVRESPSSAASQRARVVLNTPANGVSAGEVRCCYKCTSVLFCRSSFAVCFVWCCHCLCTVLECALSFLSLYIKRGKVSVRT